MSPRAYDRFMVHVDLGTEEKLADFTDSERLCHVVGVLAIAAKSPIRGMLIVGESEATAAHIAKRADVSRKVAESTLRKLKAVGILVRDEEQGAWAVHNWEEFNPSPKRDKTNAARQARWRERNGGVTPSVTPPVTASNALEEEVEEEVEDSPLPPEGVATVTPTPVKRAQLAGFDDWLADHSAVTGDTAPRSSTKLYAHLAEMFNGRIAEGRTLAELKLATRGAFNDEFRRRNGHFGAESVLRPTKNLELVNKGRRAERSTTTGPTPAQQLDSRRRTQEELIRREEASRAAQEASA